MPEGLDFENNAQNIGEPGEGNEFPLPEAVQPYVISDPVEFLNDNQKDWEKLKDRMNRGQADPNTGKTIRKPQRPPQPQPQPKPKPKPKPWGSGNAN